MQIGIAVHNYESAHEVLPPGVVDPAGPIQNCSQGLSLRLDDADSPVRRAEERLPPPSIARSGCMPRERHRPTSGDQHLPLPLRPAAAGPTSGVARHYAGCHHDVEAPIAANNTGVFFLNSSVRYEDITDGSSSTIFIGEKTIGGPRPRLGVRDPGHPQQHGDATGGSPAVSRGGSGRVPS